MNIIYPNTPYIEALANAQLTSLKQRRAQWIFLYIQIEKPQHKLHKLLPKPRTTTHNTRCRTRYSLPRVKTNRTKNCFINWCLFNQNNSQRQILYSLNLFFRSIYFNVLNYLLFFNKFNKIHWLVGVTFWHKICFNVLNIFT